MRSTLWSTEGNPSRVESERGSTAVERCGKNQAIKPAEDKRTIKPGNRELIGWNLMRGYHGWVTLMRVAMDDRGVES
ncbi:MAG: hypothetical protein OIN66_06160 [Candidatus Methanoperedens sp.]|nr:hypothetical protein [Candidatus Methanoperedens sp.]